MKEYMQKLATVKIDPDKEGELITKTSADLMAAVLATGAFDSPVPSGTETALEIMGGLRQGETGPVRNFSILIRELGKDSFPMPKPDKASMN